MAKMIFTRLMIFTGMRIINWIYGEEKVKEQYADNQSGLMCAVLGISFAFITWICCLFGVFFTAGIAERIFCAVIVLACPIICLTLKKGNRNR